MEKSFGDINGASFASCSLCVECTCCANADRAKPSNICAPTQIYVIAKECQIGIESTELLKSRTPHQHSGCTYRENFFDLIMLPLVLLARF